MTGKLHEQINIGSVSKAVVELDKVRVGKVGLDFDLSTELTNQLSSIPSFFFDEPSFVDDFEGSNEPSFFMSVSKNAYTAMNTSPNLPCPSRLSKRY